MLAMVVYLCYPSILEVEVWDQKFRDIFGYREKWGQPGIHESLCQKEKSKTRQNYCKTPKKQTKTKQTNLLNQPQQSQAILFEQSVPFHPFCLRASF